jgi:hypothetical protein
MSDGIGEWYKAQREREMNSMTQEERDTYLSPRPRLKQKASLRETPAYDDLTDDGIIYGEPPFWRQAINGARDTFRRQRETVPVATLCAASFFIGLWVGSL